MCLLRLMKYSNKNIGNKVKKSRKIKEIEQTLEVVIYFNGTLNVIYLMRAATVQCYCFKTTKGKLMSNKTLIV